MAETVADEMRFMALQHMVAQLFAELARDKANPREYLATVEAEIKDLIDGLQYAPVGQVDGEVVKHAVLSAVEETLRAAAPLATQPRR